MVNISRIIVFACLSLSLCSSGQDALAQNDAYHKAIKMAQTGQQFAAQSNWRKACSVYEQTLQVYPNYPAVKTALAQAYVEWAKQMSAPEAIPYYKRAAELDPSNAIAKAAVPNIKASGPATINEAAFSATTVSERNAKSWAVSDLKDLPDEDKIPFRKEAGNRLIVKTQVNGHDLDMQFDTGANFCMVGANHLKAVGIDPSSLKGESAVVGGAGGGAVTTIVVPMTLKIGKTSRHISMYVHPNFPGNPLVGQNFLTGLQYEVNNQLQVLILRKPQESTTTVSKRVDPRDRNVVPFTMEGKSIVVPVEVCGKTVQMIFDTGADGIVFPAYTWKELNISSAKLLGVGTARGIDGVRPILGYNVERIDFGPVNLRDITVMVSNPGPSRPLLGQKVLGSEKFIIDDKRKLIIFHR